MQFRRLIVMIVAAAGYAPTWANADDAVLSLVNPSGRIDIPAKAIIRVEPSGTFAIRNAETGEVSQFPLPHVDLCLSDDIRKRICNLTRQIVGQPLAIVVGCRTVSKPIVREPLCTRPCFEISTSDLAEATALAQQIRSATGSACAPSN
ncbi:MAG TPA: hypothetical protein VL048_02925 [Xanthobacteraceae bacterium]|nr:hypothetical protein [Xanthobacteraceae bacterium]